MRYRYIFSGGVRANDIISDYRLLDKQKMKRESDVIRIEIPDDAKLEKWDCDEYSTWSKENNRNYELKELNPKICVKINGKWNVLEDATKDWLNGQEMKTAIKNNLKDNYYQYPLFHIGYVTMDQFYFQQKNYKYAWRFDYFPADLENIKIPPLTPSQLETLSFVKEQFYQYYEVAIDESFYFDDAEKQEAKEFFKDFVENISDDDLAYAWHRYSVNSLDLNQKFETKELVDKMKRSPHFYVYKDHYKNAIKEMIDNMLPYFEKYMYQKEKDDQNLER